MWCQLTFIWQLRRFQFSWFVFIDVVYVVVVKNVLEYQCSSDFTKKYYSVALDDGLLVRSGYPFYVNPSLSWVVFEDVFEMFPCFTHRSFWLQNPHKSCYFIVTHVHNPFKLLSDSRRFEPGQVAAVSIVRCVHRMTES